MDFEGSEFHDFFEDGFEETVHVVAITVVVVAKDGETVLVSILVGKVAGVAFDACHVAALEHEGAVGWDTGHDL